MDNLSSVNPTNKHKKKRYNWKYIEKAVDDLTVKINRDKYDGVYGIPRGGLILAVMLSHRLQLPIITNQNMTTQNTLFIDDIVDSGNTLRQLRETKGNFDLTTIHCKKCDTIQPTYYYEDIDKNTWVVYPWEK